MCPHLSCTGCYCFQHLEHDSFCRPSALLSPQHDSARLARLAFSQRTLQESVLVAQPNFWQSSLEGSVRRTQANESAGSPLLTGAGPPSISFPPRTPNNHTGSSVRFANACFVQAHIEKVFAAEAALLLDEVEPMKPSPHLARCAAVGPPKDVEKKVAKSQPKENTPCLKGHVTW